MQDDSIYILHKAQVDVLNTEDLLKGVFDRLGMDWVPQAHTQAFSGGMPTAPAPSQPAVVAAPSQGVAPPATPAPQAVAPAPTLPGSAPAISKKDTAATHAERPASSGSHTAGQLGTGVVVMGTGASSHGYPIGTVSIWKGGRRMKKVDEKHWVPVDQHNAPLRGEAGFRVEPHIENAHMMTNAMKEHLGLAGENIGPWEDSLFHETEDRGAGMIEDKPKGELPEDRVARSGRKSGQMTMKAEGWRTFKEYVSHLTEKATIMMKDEINRGGGWGLTNDGRVIRLKPGKGDNTVLHPPANVVQYVRTYLAPRGGRPQFIMSFFHGGMESNREVHVGEDMTHSIETEKKILEEYMAGSRDKELIMNVLTQDERDSYDMSQGVEGLDPAQKAVFDRLKVQRIEHQKSCVELLHNLRDTFGNVFYLSKDFVMTKDFLEQYGKPSSLTNAWMVHQRHGKYVEDAIKAGHDRYVLDYDKKNKQVRRLYYEAAEIVSSMLAEHGGTLPKKERIKLQNYANKIRAKTGMKIDVRTEPTGDARIKIMNEKVNLDSDFMMLQEGGSGNQNLVMDLPKKITGKAERVEKGKGTGKKTKYSYTWKPLESEVKFEIAGLGLPKSIKADYMDGDMGRSEVAYWQTSKALTNIARKKVHDKEFNRLLVDAKAKGMPTKTKTDLKRISVAAAKNIGYKNWDTGVAECVMKPLNDPSTGDALTHGSLQPELSARKEGAGNGFEPLAGGLCSGREIVDKDQVATMMVRDLAFGFNDRNIYNTQADDSGNVMASDNAHGFSFLGTPSFTFDQISKLANHVMDSDTIEMFKGMTAKDLREAGVQTEKYVPGGNQAQRTAITPEQLHMAALTMRGLGQYLADHGGKMPDEAELVAMDRRDERFAHKPMLEFETYIRQPALSFIGRAKTSYTQELLGRARAENAAYNQWNAAKRGGEASEDIEAPIMPSVYYTAMEEKGK